MGDGIWKRLFVKNKRLFSGVLCVLLLFGSLMVAIQFSNVSANAQTNDYFEATQNVRNVSSGCRNSGRVHEIHII